MVEEAWACGEIGVEAGRSEAAVAERIALGRAGTMVEGSPGEVEQDSAAVAGKVDRDNAAAEDRSRVKGAGNRFVADGFEDGKEGPYAGRAADNSCCLPALPGAGTPQIGGLLKSASSFL